MRRWLGTLILALAILFPSVALAEVSGPNASGEYTYSLMGQTALFQEQNGTWKVNYRVPGYYSEEQALGLLRSAVSSQQLTQAEAALHTAFQEVTTYAAAHPPPAAAASPQNPGQQAPAGQGTAGPQAPPIHLQNYLKADNLRSLIVNDIPSFLVEFIGVVFLIMFFVNALRYLWAGSTAFGGESGQRVLSDAKTGMAGAVIGLVVALLAYAIVSFFKSAISGS